MDGSGYYHSYGYKTYSPTGNIWGLGDQTLGYIIMGCIALMFIALVLWGIYGDSIAEWWNDRPSRKRIKSLVIKVKGTDMTQHKFQLTTDDINKLFASGKLRDRSGYRGKKELSAKNIISITNVLGDDCRYFVVWYKEGL